MRAVRDVTRKADNAYTRPSRTAHVCVCHTLSKRHPHTHAARIDRRHAGIRLWLVHTPKHAEDSSVDRGAPEGVQR